MVFTSLCLDQSIRDNILLITELTNLSIPPSCIDSKPINCSDPGVYIELVHVPNNVSSKCTSIERIAFTVVYPILLILAIFGNALNLAVYNRPFFKGSKAVHLLRARAAVNLAYVLSLLMLAVHEWTKDGIVVTNANFERFYGNYHIYSSALTNVFGNLNSWYTLMITVEIAACIIHPVFYKQKITFKMILSAILFCVVSSLIINCLIPLTRSVHLTTRPVQPASAKKCIQFYAPRLRNGSLMMKLDKAYYWMEVVFVNCLPISLMMLCAILVSIRIKRLSMPNVHRHMSARRKCVLRITFATTFLHLLCTAPSFIIMAIAALKGSSGRGVSPTMCIASVLGNFLNLFNSTLPFFVYVICSKQFQRMSLSILGIRQEPTSQTENERRTALVDHPTGTTINAPGASGLTNLTASTANVQSNAFNEITLDDPCISNGNDVLLDGDATTNENRVSMAIASRKWKSTDVQRHNSRGSIKETLL